MGRGVKGFTLHLGEFLEGRQVAPVNLEEFSADGRTESGWAVGEFEAKQVEEDLAGKRVAVGVKTIGGESDQGIAHFDSAAVEKILAVGHTGNRAG